MTHKASKAVGHAPNDIKRYNEIIGLKKYWPKEMLPRILSWPRLPTDTRTIPQHGELHPDDIGGAGAHMHLPRNPHPEGRDFFMGDLHGEFTQLEALLNHLQFNRERDRLISVGDLIDRGPESHRYTEFIDHPWFHAVRGNHEQKLIDRDRTGKQSETYDTICAEFGQDAAEKAVQCARERPLAMTVETAWGPIGVVHANIPPDRTWAEFCAALQQGDRLDTAYALFSYEQRPVSVPDLYALFFGHAHHYYVRWRGIAMGIDFNRHPVEASIIELSQPQWQIHLWQRNSSPKQPNDKNCTAPPPEYDVVPIPPRPHDPLALPAPDGMLPPEPKTRGLMQRLRAYCTAPPPEYDVVPIPPRPHDPLALPAPDGMLPPEPKTRGLMQRLRACFRRTTPSGNQR